LTKCWASRVCRAVCVSCRYIVHCVADIHCSHAQLVAVLIWGDHLATATATARARAWRGAPRRVSTKRSARCRPMCWWTGRWNIHHHSSSDVTSSSSSSSSGAERGRARPSKAEASVNMRTIYRQHIQSSSLSTQWRASSPLSDQLAVQCTCWLLADLSSPLTSSLTTRTFVHARLIAVRWNSSNTNKLSFSYYVSLVTRFLTFLPAMTLLWKLGYIGCCVFFLSLRLVYSCYLCIDRREILHDATYRINVTISAPDRSSGILGAVPLGDPSNTKFWA